VFKGPRKDRVPTSRSLDLPCVPLSGWTARSDRIRIVLARSRIPALSHHFVISVSLPRENRHTIARPQLQSSARGLPRIPFAWVLSLQCAGCRQMPRSKRRWCETGMSKRTKARARLCWRGRTELRAVDRRRAAGR
jgi:hypothetical protein